MKYCNNCGTKLSENQEFCSECGKPVNQKNTINITSKIPSINENRSEPNGPQSSSASKQSLFKSQKSKISTICGLIAFALIMGGYYVVKQMTTPMAVAEGFIEAIDKKDAAKMKTYINEGQYEIKVDDKEAKEFIAYLHGHPRMITSIAEGLMHDASVYEDNNSSNLETATSPYASIKNAGKKWAFFRNYTIQIPTFYTEITSDIENTEIYINDKKEATLKDTNKTFGPFLPGEYTVKAVVNGEYGKVEKEQKIDTFNVEDQTGVIDFDWSDHFVSLNTNYDDAILFINNKSTQKQMGELNEIGPVPLDGSIRFFAQRKFNEGVKKSNVVPLIEGTSEVDLSIDFEETTIDTKVTFNPTENDSIQLGDIEPIIKQIRKEYNSINNQTSSMTKKNITSLEGYKKQIFINNQGMIKKAIAKTSEGTVEYYYDDTQTIFFIFFYNGKVESRFYFHQNQMIRWIDPSRVPIDYDQGKGNSQYKNWENYWIQKAYE